MARSTWAPDYPWATPTDALLESSVELLPHLHDGAVLEVMAPSLADDPQARQMFARFQRYAASPAMLQQNMLTMHSRSTASVTWRNSISSGPVGRTGAVASALGTIMFQRWLK